MKIYLFTNIYYFLLYNNNSLIIEKRKLRIYRKVIFWTSILKKICAIFRPSNFYIAHFFQDKNDRGLIII